MKQKSKGKGKTFYIKPFFHFLYTFYYKIPSLSPPHLPSSLHIHPHIWLLNFRVPKCAFTMIENHNWLSGNGGFVNRLLILLVGFSPSPWNKYNVPKAMILFETKDHGLPCSSDLRAHCFMFKGFVGSQYKNLERDSTGMCSRSLLSCPPSLVFV